MKYAEYSLHKTNRFGTLTQLTCFIFLLKFIEMLSSYKKCQKFGVTSGLGRVRAKNLLGQTNLKCFILLSALPMMI